MIEGDYLVNGAMNDHGGAGHIGRPQAIREHVADDAEVGTVDDNAVDRKKGAVQDQSCDRVPFNSALGRHVAAGS